MVGGADEEAAASLTSPESSLPLTGGERRTAREGNANPAANATTSGEAVVAQAELAPDVNGLIETAIRDHDSWRDRQIVVAEIVATTPTPPMIFLKKENLMLPKFNSHEEVSTISS